MLRGGEAPLWPDATTRFPVLLLSHGYGGSPIGNDYLIALTVFASFGYVVVAPFHTDATFSDLQNLEGFLDFLYLVTHLEQFNAMQALRPLALSAGLDYVLGHPHWRDRIDATQVGGFGASMGAESMLLLGGAELTTTVLQASKPVTFEPRLKAAVGYVPYFGQIGFPAFGQYEHGLDGVGLSYLAIAGTADTTAPLSETLRGIGTARRTARSRRDQRREARARPPVDSRHLHVVGDLPRCRGSRRRRGAREAPPHDERRGRRRRPRARSVQRPTDGSAGRAQRPGHVVERAGGIGSGLGHQLRPPGRGDLRHLVHPRRQRPGVVHVDDGVPDRTEHLRRHALHHDRPAARCRAVRPEPGAVRPGGVRHADLRRRQQRDLRLHGQRHRPDQGDHPAGVRGGADVHVGRACEPGAGDATTRTCGGRQEGWSPAGGSTSPTRAT